MIVIFSFEGAIGETRSTLNTSGDYDEEVTPVPIPNTVVKLLDADDSWLETTCENMTSPDLSEGSVQKAQGFLFCLLLLIFVSDEADYSFLVLHCARSAHEIPSFRREAPHMKFSCRTGLTHEKNE